MSFFRSEPMSLCQILLHKESAFDCLVELGYLGVVQFNEPVERTANLKFTNEVTRCSEIQRVMQQLESEMEEFEIKPVFVDMDIAEKPQAKDLKEIEMQVQALDTELSDVEVNYDELRKRHAYLLEELHVLTKVSEFLTGERNTEAVMAWSNSVVMDLLQDGVRHQPQKDQQHLRLSFFAGAIPVERFPAFQLMLWRVCHRNFYLKHAEILVLLEDMHKFQADKRKYAFMVFFVGELMREKIMKVCQGFRATLYECPESYDERRDIITRTTNELADLQIVLKNTDEHRRRILRRAASQIYVWKAKTKEILMVFLLLNKLGTVRHLENQRYLQSECWIPTKDIKNVQSAMTRGAARAAKGDAGMMFPPLLIVQNHMDPTVAPTYFRLNKFTRGFQNLIDAYGIACYQEVNPAPYTIITFPFLFAVMFGDIGHGLIMALFGLWMVYKEKQIILKKRTRAKANEIADILFAGRYVVLMMGVFSMYTGFIYNIVFAKTTNIFGSKWHVAYNYTTVLANNHIQLDPSSIDFYDGYPYPIGLDPVWGASSDSAIIMENSIKMKIAIILGVVQMIFGLILSAVDYSFNKQYVDLFLVFLPQLLFLICLFFYLVVLIFLKWILYGGLNKFPYNSACAPSILITFINMIMMSGQSKLPPECPQEMYTGEKYVEYALVVIAELCIPVLLLGKPLYYLHQRRRIQQVRDNEAQRLMQRASAAHLRRTLVYNVEFMESTITIVNPSESFETPDVTELWIHQGIHCIESVLGSVSHSASYLRLWALSLAHDQLSTVLWRMVLSVGLEKGRGYVDSVVLYVVFAFWAVLTITILVVMEGLSAFLHTLRLHWVEFQSKFYRGTVLWLAAANVLLKYIISFAIFLFPFTLRLLR